MKTLIRKLAIKSYDLVTHRQFLNKLYELNQTQHLSREALDALQQKKLLRLLEYASVNVPYYQRLFKEVNFKPRDILTDPESFQKIPILTKAIIGENFEDLLTTETQRRKQMTRLTTGGSTGQPLVFMQDNNFRDFVTADIHRHLGWAGWQLGQVHAYIWGTNFEVASSQSFRTRLMDWTLNRFVTNAYVLSDESMSAFVAQIRQKRPGIIFCYPSSLYRFAEFCLQKGLDDIKFEALFSSAEVLYPAQREFIEKVFGGKMFNRYGTRELGGLSCECEAHTGLHASIDNNNIEITQSLEGNKPVLAGEMGHVIVTNLNNLGMPFIRYSVGDMGTWSTDDSCPCGRELPIMELVQGRRIDMFKTRDGRSVWGGFASPLFGIKGVARFQLIQKTLDDVVVRIVKDRDFDGNGLTQIERTIKIALGEQVSVKFEFPDEIKVHDSGKYRYAISELTDS